MSETHFAILRVRHAPPTIETMYFLSCTIALDASNQNERDLLEYAKMYSRQRWTKSRNVFKHRLVVTVHVTANYCPR